MQLSQVRDFPPPREGSHSSLLPSSALVPTRHLCVWSSLAPQRSTGFGQTIWQRCLSWCKVRGAMLPGHGRGGGWYLPIHSAQSLAIHPLSYTGGEANFQPCAVGDRTLPVVFPRDGAKAKEKEGCINKEESFWKFHTISGKRLCLHLGLLVLNLGLLLLSCLVFIC